MAFRIQQGDGMRNYMKDWVSQEGKSYRMDFYRRNQVNLLRDNPTIEQLYSDLDWHKPTSILEVGCGFGRLLSPITALFHDVEVTGCDVSPDMLELCDENLNTFHWDVCKPDPTGRTGRNPWDVAFSRGVFMYFNVVQICKVLKNLNKVVSRKILIYEWPDVCEEVLRCSRSSKLEFHPIEQKPE